MGWCEHKEPIALGANPYCTIATLQEPVGQAQTIFAVGTHSAIAAKIAHKMIVGIIDSYHTVFASCPDVTVAVLKDGTNVVASKIKCLTIITFHREGVLAE